MDSLEDVNVEVLAETAGIVVENCFGVSKTLQNRNDFHGLIIKKREDICVSVWSGTFNDTFSAVLTETHLPQIVVSALIHGAEVVDDQLGGFSLP